MKRAAILLLSAGVAFSAARHTDYALILEDAPVAAVRTSEARVQQQAIAGKQRTVTDEVRRRGVKVVGAGQVLVNAIFVSATVEEALALREIAGVKHVVATPPLHLDLDRAVGLTNVPAAWSAIGGTGRAGAGIKIGIIDSGIDQQHPGFQDASLQVPAGFPKGDAAYTNNKVIVARSYVDLDSAGYDPKDPVATSHPDDYSPRDRQGHGTSIAMIAAGVQNSGPQGTIQGVAPKAFLGNYKIVGSPGINDFARFAAFNKALEDALADGMDIVTLSLSEGSPAYYGPLDSDPQCGGACDIYSQAVENAVAKGMVVVTSAGNDGNIGKRVPTLTTIHFPGTAPSAITVGATTNSHVFYQAVRINGTGVPSNVQNIRTLFGDGPKIASALTLPVRAAAGDGLACSALDANSLAGAIALIQRGTCDFTTKINNAQSAGAVAVILYQTSGVEAISSTLFAQSTGIPAVMIGNTAGAALKNYLSSNSGAQATLDPAWTASEDTADLVWPSSSRGPSPGTFGSTPTTAIKPELVAPGVNLYSATQKLDPNADGYHASGYAAFSGTSYAVPMVAGVVALVKQKYPSMTPAQLKSAVVNTASQSVTDENGTARINSMGAGKLNAADAVNVSATVEPATLHFGVIAVGSLPISKTLRIVSTGSTATYSVTVQQRDADSNARVQVSPSSLTGGNVTVTLTGTRPNPGSYEGFIVISGGGTTLRVPYQYLVGSGTVTDAFPIGNGGFLGGTSDTGWEIDLRAIDQYGVPVVTTPVLFSAVSGGGKISAGDAQTFRLGNAAALVDLGPNEGDQIFQATVGGLRVEFDGFARAYPTIRDIRDAAANEIVGLAPGAYASIYGTQLSDALQIEPTLSLPVSLSGVSVSFDAGGLSLPGGLHFVATNQVNVQVPWEFQGQSSVSVKVTVTGLPTAVYTLPLATYSPGIFAITGTDYARFTQTRPAARGDRVLLFANGLGPVDVQPGSREPPSPPVVNQTKNKPTVTVGGVDAAVEFSGLSAGTVGLYQINAVIPPNAPGGAQPVVITIGGVRSQPATLFVAP